MQILHISSPWFELVRSGEKIYEGRRNTSRTSELTVGQQLEIRHFTNCTAASYFVTIVDILHYPTFEHAMRALPLKQILPVADITVEKGIEIYKKLVSLPTQQKDGVVMIKLHLHSPV
jgi:ASC-1-like (ASCH) protein